MVKYGLLRILKEYYVLLRVLRVAYVFGGVLMGSSKF